MTDVEQLLRDTFAAREVQAPTGGDLAQAAQARVRPRSRRRWVTPLAGATVAVVVVVAVWAVSAGLIRSSGPSPGQPAGPSAGAAVPAAVLTAAETLRDQPGVRINQPVEWIRVTYGRYLQLVAPGMRSPDSRIDSSDVYVIRFRGTFPYPGKRSTGPGSKPPESYPVQDQIVCVTAGCAFRSGGPMFQKRSLKFASETLQPGVVDLLEPADLAKIGAVSTFVVPVPPTGTVTGVVAADGGPPVAHQGPVAGQSVTLLDASGRPAATTRTAANGSFTVQVPAGTYRVLGDVCAQTIHYVTVTAGHTQVLDMTCQRR
jgi:hypothetical protein